MDGICRTCMTSNKPVRSLFEVDSDLIELHVKLYTCFPTFNLDDSDFPKTICDSCVKMLQNAYKFRELCLKSTCIFLRKRKYNNQSTNTKKKTVTSIAVNTDNEQVPVLNMPTLIPCPSFINNNPDISDQNDTYSSNQSNISDIRNNSNIQQETINPSEKETQTSNEIPENSANEIINTANTINEIINTANTINDKIENTNNNIEINESHDKVLNNENKKFIKVYPLKSVQTKNSFESESFSGEKDIIDKNSNNEEQSVLPNLNSLDILVKHKDLIQNQMQHLNTSDSNKENDLVYRIDIVGGDESSSVNTSNNLKISEITDENAVINAENKSNNNCNETITSNEKTSSKSSEDTISSESTSNSNENCSKDIIENLTDVNCQHENQSNIIDDSKNSLTNYPNQTEINIFTSSSTSSIPINEHNVTDIQRSIATNTFEKEEENLSDNESLLKPLENYTENNFIMSSLTCDVESDSVDSMYEDDSFEEKTQSQNELVVVVNLLRPPGEDNNLMSSICESNNEIMNLDDTGNEIELQENVHPVIELKIENDKNSVDAENIENLESNLTKSLVKDIPSITPVPLSKLISHNSTSIQSSPQIDEVDDLVNQNVTEVYDFSNHNDHNYARMSCDTNHLLPDIKVKRKRRMSVRLEASKGLQFDSAEQLKTNVINKKQTKMKDAKSKKVNGNTIRKIQTRMKNLKLENSKLKKLNSNVSNKKQANVKELNLGSSTSKELKLNVNKKSNINRRQTTNDLKLDSKELKPNVISKSQTMNDLKLDCQELNQDVVQTNIKDLKLDNSKQQTNESPPIVSKTVKRRRTRGTEKEVKETNTSSSSVQSLDVSQTKKQQKLVSPESNPPETLFKRSYETRASSASDTNSSPPKVEWKVKRIRSKRSTKASLKLKLQTVAVKNKTTNLTKITRSGKKLTTPKGDITETRESKPIQKEQTPGSKPVQKEQTPASKSIQKVQNSELKSVQKEKSLELKSVPKEHPPDSKSTQKEQNSGFKYPRKEHTTKSKLIQEKQATEEMPAKKSRIERNVEKNNESSSSLDFTSSIKLNEVVRNDEDLEYPYGCDLCDLRVKSLAILELHLSTHVKRKCGYCDRLFRNVAGYKRHETSVYKNLPGSEQFLSHTCEICEKMFPSRSCYIFHKKTHKSKKSN